jgi:hypothetical protein
MTYMDYFNTGVFALTIGLIMSLGVKAVRKILFDIFDEA